MHVARRVGDDEFPARRREIARQEAMLMGGSSVFLSLGCKLVHQQRQKFSGAALPGRR